MTTPATKGAVLVVDDETDLLELVGYNLQREGYTLVAARTGEAGLAAALSRPPSVILLDRQLPDLDGLEICRRLRRDERTCHLPVILLTARATEADRVAGLEAGADDYVTKPFSPRELLARIKAVMRRAATRPPPQEVVQVGDLVIDVARHQVTFRGKAVPVTVAEFKILRFMAARHGRVLSRAEVIEGALGGSADGLSRTIDVHLAAIRKKLGAATGLIETVRGIGYKLVEAGRPVAARER